MSGLAQGRETPAAYPPSLPGVPDASSGRGFSTVAVAAPPTGSRILGRDREIALLLQQLLPSGAKVSFVHGVAGIGKSALLSAFTAEAMARDRTVIELDGRAIEPTQRGFLAVLSTILGADRPEPSLQQVSERLAHGAPIVIVIDNYEVLRLLDTWLRQVFAPTLAEDVRLVIASREAPVAQWLVASAPLVLTLEPLARTDAIAFLRALHISDDLAPRIADVVRGHPMALMLAASTARERSDLGPRDIATHRALSELADLYLEGIEDVSLRETVEAGSVVRRVTIGMLQAMLPGAGEARYDQLRRLPFVERRHDGLVLHEAVRDAVAASLKASDPTRYRDYRRRAWRYLRVELREAAPSELWRSSADMTYIFENPAVREAYFPSGAQSLAVEPARSEDWPSIERITGRHLQAEEALIVQRWWRAAPHTFAVARDRDSLVVAFLIFVDGKSILPLAVPEDPVVRQWADDLRADPLGRGQLAQGLRLWLDIEHADAPSSAQAAGFLDCKRSYMALRPRLARMYLTMRDVATYWPILEQLEFRQLPAGPVTIDSSTYTTGRLDFGAGSVDGWLARLVATELGLDQTSPLDPSARQIAIDGDRVQLTRLEFGVIESLARRDGRALSRRQLIEEVWGYDFDGGSNIVDSVVRALRRKLGTHGPLVETVRGVGYRLPQGWENQLS